MRAGSKTSKFAVAGSNTISSKVFSNSMPFLLFFVSLDKSAFLSFTHKFLQNAAFPLSYKLSLKTKINKNNNGKLASSNLKNLF